MSGVAIADVAVISGADVIAAYGRELATAGGCGGRPATPATLRVYASMVRALARDLGRDAQVDGVWIPRHEPEPPATLIDTDYANLLRVPDRRMVAGKRMLAGKRDYARDGPGHRLRDRSAAVGSVRTWPSDCPPRDAGWRCPLGST